MVIDDAVTAVSVTPVLKFELVDICHFVTVPVFPDKVKVVEFVPVHTVAPPDTVPPTDVGDTVIVADAEFADEQGLLVTTAL